MSRFNLPSRYVCLGFICDSYSFIVPFYSHGASDARASRFDSSQRIHLDSG